MKIAQCDGLHDGSFTIGDGPRLLGTPKKKGKGRRNRKKISRAGPQKTTGAGDQKRKRRSVVNIIKKEGQDQELGKKEEKGAGISSSRVGDESSSLRGEYLGPKNGEKIVQKDPRWERGGGKDDDCPRKRAKNQKKKKKTIFSPRHRSKSTGEKRPAGETL